MLRNWDFNLGKGNSMEEFLESDLDFRWWISGFLNAMYKMNPRKVKWTQGDPEGGCCNHSGSEAMATWTKAVVMEMEKNR